MCVHASCILLIRASSHCIAAARPTMAELIITDRKDGSCEPLQVIQQIASASAYKCNEFAHKLLGDDHVIKLQMQIEKHEELIPLVLNDWLERDDEDTTAVPRTWTALAQCVQWANMDADLIQAIRTKDPKGSSVVDPPLHIERTVCGAV